MPVFVIQAAADPFFTTNPTLDGVEYSLRFTYNQREDAYYLSIENPATNTDIISGIKIVTNFPLLQNKKGMPGMPPGDILAISNNSDDSPAGLGDLDEGGRITLYYFDSVFLATGA